MFFSTIINTLITFIYKPSVSPGMAKLEDELEIARQLKPDSNEAGAERCYWHLRDTGCHGHCRGFREGCEDYMTTNGRIVFLEADIARSGTRMHEAEKRGDKKGELEKTLNIEGGNRGIGGGYPVGAAASPHSNM
jgi:hypothetical protein